MPYSQNNFFTSSKDSFYSGQKWVFWRPIRWVHFFKSSLLPHPWHNFKKMGAKWKIWILSFHWHLMSMCGFISLDTTSLQSWAFLRKHPKGWKIDPFFQRWKPVFCTLFFQNAVIQWQINIFPWNQLQMATNFLNFPWEKANFKNLNPF